MHGHPLAGIPHGSDVLLKFLGLPKVPMHLDAVPAQQGHEPRGPVALVPHLVREPSGGHAPEAEGMLRHHPLHEAGPHRLPRGSIRIREARREVDDQVFHHPGRGPPQHRRRRLGVESDLLDGGGLGQQRAEGVKQGPVRGTCREPVVAIDGVPVCMRKGRGGLDRMRDGYRGRKGEGGIWGSGRRWGGTRVGGMGGQPVYSREGSAGSRSGDIRIMADRRRTKGGTG